MDAATGKHSTRLALLDRLLADDGEPTPARAVQRYGPPEWVAEMNRLVEVETARLFPPPKPPGETEWDREQLNRWLATAPPLGEKEWNLELTRVATKSELSDCQIKLWRYLKAEGTAWRLVFSYQPTDPAAARVTIASDRCRYLNVLSPGTLLVGGALAIAMMTPAGDDTLRLDGHELRHVRIHPASGPGALPTPTADPSPPRAGTGRAPASYWAEARMTAFTWMKTRGVPQPGDGQQADLERHISEWLDKRGLNAGESSIRRHVTTWIKEKSA